MRLPRKAQNKTRTLHVCFVCDLMNCCVKNMYNMNDVRSCVVFGLCA